MQLSVHYHWILPGCPTFDTWLAYRFEWVNPMIVFLCYTFLLNLLKFDSMDHVLSELEP
jgi:hypothetical protein